MAAKERLQKSKHDGERLNWHHLEIKDGQRVLHMNRVSKEYSIPGKVVGVQSGRRGAWI